jgi:hypothetical protein
MFVRIKKLIKQKERIFDKIHKINNKQIKDLSARYHRIWYSLSIQ